MPVEIELRYTEAPHLMMALRGHCPPVKLLTIALNDSP